MKRAISEEFMLRGRTERLFQSEWRLGRNGAQLDDAGEREIAFHEKAGRSQVGFFVFSLDTVFSPAEPPLSPPFHPHS